MSAKSAQPFAKPAALGGTTNLRLADPFMIFELLEA